MLFGKTISLPCGPQVRANHAAYAVIRPEAIKLAEGSGSVTGEVKAAIYFGSQVEYAVEISDQELIVVDNDPQPGGIFPMGSQVSLAFDPSRSYLLPHDA
jgi:ABC-type Fe3+/spermidine/putrescine transport system ATPase subunit